jgi:hypothetical protein
VTDQPPSTLPNTAGVGPQGSRGHGAGARRLASGAILRAYIAAADASSSAGDRTYQYWRQRALQDAEVMERGASAQRAEA